MNGYEAITALKEYIQASYHTYLIEADLTDFSDSDIVIGSIDTAKYQNDVVLFLMTERTDYGDESTTSDLALTNVKVFFVIRNDEEEKLDENIFIYIALLRLCLYKCYDFDNIQVKGYDTFNKMTEADKDTGKRYGVLELVIQYSEEM